MHACGLLMHALSFKIVRVSELNLQPKSPDFCQQRLVQEEDYGEEVKVAEIF